MKCPYCIAGTVQAWITYPGTADAARGGGHYEDGPCDNCGGSGEIDEEASDGQEVQPL